MSLYHARGRIIVPGYMHHLYLSRMARFLFYFKYTFRLILSLDGTLEDLWFR